MTLNNKKPMNITYFINKGYIYKKNTPLKNNILQCKLIHF